MQDRRELSLPTHDKKIEKSKQFLNLPVEEKSAAPSVNEESHSQVIPPMSMKSLSQLVADFARNREHKESRRQCSLEAFTGEVDKFVQEMKEEYEQGRAAGESQPKPMNYEIFQKYFDFQPHILQSFYPQQLQQLLQKKKHVSFEKLPSFMRPSARENQRKAYQKMRLFTQCQYKFIELSLFGISQRSKLIKKKEKAVHENLKRKRIFLEQEGFDIRSFLYEQSHHDAAAKTS